MISIKNLNKTYTSGTKAVDNLSLEVEHGEIFALLGPNGAGKSSTIRVLTTLSGFDDGIVKVAGFNVDTHPQDVRASIGYVAQDTGVDYFLTGRENLTLQGHLYRMSKSEIDNRISELTSYFGIQEALDELVSNYSGGMRRKLDIATALIHKPKIIFLDEPTLGLDTQSRQNLWQYIRKLNNELGLTILLTTHYLDEADKLASRVAIIDKGQIKTIGKPEDLKDQINGDVVSLQFEDIQNKDNVVNRLTKNDFIKESKWEQDKLHLYVSNGASCIPQLIEQCNQMTLHVKNVSFARPSLDDVFIKITGTSIEAKSDEGENKWWEKWTGKGGGGAWAKKWQEKNTDLTEETPDGNSSWQGEASKWSEDEQQQWWAQQNEKQTSVTNESPPNETIADNKQNPESSSSISEENSDWKAESSKWSEDEQAAWWSNKLKQNSAESEAPEKSKSDEKLEQKKEWPDKNWPDTSGNWDNKNKS